MARERAFLLLKPDGVPREAEIMAIVGKHARVVAERRFARAPLKRLAALYAEHEGKVFYPRLLASFRGKPVKAFILEPRKAGSQPGAFHRLLVKLVGATNPREATPGTVRALSDDALEVSMRQKRAVRNLVHRSLTPGDSLREGALFFFDAPGPGEEAVRPEPFALEFVNPLTPIGASLEGIFHGERLQGLLRRMELIPAGARLTSYREAPPEGRRRNPPVLLVMRAGFRHRGESHETRIEILED